MINGRELQIQNDELGEFWQLSQNSLKIMRGKAVSQSHYTLGGKGGIRAEPVAIYEEDPSQFENEADIFNRVYLPYLEPSERCA